MGLGLGTGSVEVVLPAPAVLCCGKLGMTPDCASSFDS